MARRNSDSCVDLMQNGELEGLSRRNSESINGSSNQGNTNQSNYSRSLSLHYLQYHGSRRSNAKPASKEATMEEGDEEDEAEAEADAERNYMNIHYSMSGWKFFRTIKSLLHHITRNIAPSSSSSSSSSSASSAGPPHHYVCDNQKNQNQSRSGKKDRRTSIFMERIRGNSSSSSSDSMSNVVVTGTLYGRRRGRIILILQEAPSPSAHHHRHRHRHHLHHHHKKETSSLVVVIELPMQTSALLREMATGLVKIALECKRTTSEPDHKHKIVHNHVIAASPVVRAGNAIHHRISDVNPADSAAFPFGPHLRMAKNQDNHGQFSSSSTDQEEDEDQFRYGVGSHGKRWLHHQQRRWPSQRVQSVTGDLLREPSWVMHCNGRKVGFAVRRSGGTSASDLHILSLLQGVSMGAGILPTAISALSNPSSDSSPSTTTSSTPASAPASASDSGTGLLSDDGHVLYLRSSFQRVIGSSDSQAFYMINPDHGFASGPDLSIFFHRSPP